LFVKLHVKDGCGKAVDIPVKNLLRVNAKKETLSNEASYSILRHCALSQLFRFEPNQQIPTYAWRNFLTRFTYESSQYAHAHGQIVKYNINNNSELTEALEVAASIHLIELDEYEYEYCKNETSKDKVVEKTTTSSSTSKSSNVIILDIHCEFINRRSVHVHRQRKDATIAAEHVVKTLQEWIQKASAFVVDIVGDLEHRDYVVVASTSNAGSSNGSSARFGSSGVNQKGASGVQKGTKLLGEDEKKDGDKRNRNRNQHPMEWAKRFIQVLLLPEDTKDSPVMVEHSHCSPSCKNSKNNNHNHNLLDEYEESLEVLTESFVQGLKRTSKFIHRIVKEHQEKARKNRRLIDDDEDNLSLSASPTPSLVKSVASISSSSSSHIDDFVVEQGIEIVFDPNNQNKSVGSNGSTSSNNNGDKDEWKIFFGESKEEKEEGEEEAVMISNLCEDEVISLSSSSSLSEHNSRVVVEDSSSTASSFEQVSEAKDEDSDDDDVSWAMLSDDE